MIRFSFYFLREMMYIFIVGVGVALFLPIKFAYDPSHY